MMFRSAEGSEEADILVPLSPSTHMARDVLPWLGMLCILLDMSPSEILREAGIPPFAMAALRSAAATDAIHSVIVGALERLARTAAGDLPADLVTSLRARAAR